MAEHSESYPDGPRVELDDAIASLIVQAERVRAAQGRLRSLLHAVQTVVGESDLAAVLRRVVEAAVELVEAEYGALGVIAADGSSLDQFIHVGLDPDAAASIGHLPRGRGLLGAVIADPNSIRLEHLADDERSSGFPPHHPQMDSFLGSPVRVRGEVFGNLYLTNARKGSFGAEDQRLLEALATTAGFAIQNARLLAEARMRAEWMSATADLSAAILSTSPEQILDLVAGRVIDLSAGARVTIMVPTDDPTRLRVAAVRGSGEQGLAGETLDADVCLASTAMQDGPVRMPERNAAKVADPTRVVDAGRSGSAASVPLRSRQRTWGALCVARAPGAPEFAETELDVLDALASQASIALELAYARSERQKAILSDERARIARDLHDHVIQQLFSAGLTLQSLSASTEQTHERGRIDEVVGQLDDAIKQIRTVIFAISARDGDSVRHRVIDIVAEVSGGLRHPPALRFAGPVDALVTGSLSDDVVGVVRELLANSVRHAHADRISLDVGVADGTVQVLVSDDGGGIVGDRRSGLLNLDERARARGGAFEIETGPTGTRARWRAPLVARAAGTEPP